jgi:hypothetical protein
MRRATLLLLTAVALGSGASASATSCPPVAEFIADTHLDAGRQIGAHFAAAIRARFNTSSLLHGTLLPFAATPAGAAAVATLSNGTAARFPGYWDEARGIAEGAGVPFLHAALMNFRDEIAFLAPVAGGGGRGAMSKSCSDYSLLDPSAGTLPLAAAAGDSVVGHNEDGGSDDVGYTHVLTVTVGGSPPFSAYTYAGEVPTAAFGWNGALGFTLNSLHPDTVLHDDSAGGGAPAPTVGRNFVSRSLLDATSLEDAVARATVGGRATGHNYQIFTPATQAVAGAAPAQLVHIETRPTAQSFVHRVAPGSALFHANCYLYLEQDGTNVSSFSGQQPWECIDSGTHPNPDSAGRMARGAALYRERGAPASAADVRAVLGDAKNASGFPIYADPLLPNADDRKTLNSAVFDLRSGEVVLLAGNPQRQSVCGRFKFAQGQPQQQEGWR